jgi:hypothetical protein
MFGQNNIWGETANGTRGQVCGRWQDGRKISEAELVKFECEPQSDPSADDFEVYLTRTKALITTVLLGLFIFSVGMGLLSIA